MDIEEIKSWMEMNNPCSMATQQNWWLKGYYMYCNNLAFRNKVNQLITAEVLNKTYEVLTGYYIYSVWFIQFAVK